MSCQDTCDTGRRVTITSDVTLANNRVHCAVNDGRQHSHRINVENRRYETVIVKGRGYAYHHQVDFSKWAGPQAPEWSIDIQAIGYKQSTDRAQIIVTTFHTRPDEDLNADLTLTFDDNLDSEENAPSAGPPIRLHSRVSL